MPSPVSIGPSYFCPSPKGARCRSASVTVSKGSPPSISTSDSKERFESDFHQQSPSRASVETRPHAEEQRVAMPMPSPGSAEHEVFGDFSQQAWTRRVVPRTVSIVRGTMLTIDWRLTTDFPVLLISSYSRLERFSVVGGTAFSAFFCSWSFMTSNIGTTYQCHLRPPRVSYIYYRQRRCGNHCDSPE